MYFKAWLSILKLLTEYTSNGQLSRYIIDERARFLTVGERSYIHGMEKVRLYLAVLER